MFYAQVNLDEFLICQIVSEKLLELAKNPNNNKPSTQCACCQECHADGGKYYGMVVQFKSSHRWLPIKKYMLQQYQGNLHFSLQNTGYVAA